MKYLIITATTLLMLFLGSCRSDDIEEEIENEEEGNEEVVIDRSAYTDWDDATHGNEVEPDYSIVFTQDKVLRFDITIASEDWSTMQSDLAANLGTTSGGGGRRITSLDSDYDPVWVPCNVEFDGTNWYNVGVRFKGNSSLQSAYKSGNNKLSLKLDFDEFEDDYPGITNQRFYGFKQLNLNNNYDDASLMREKVGADLFREFGLAAAQTTFCIVYLDNGTGSKYYGVYALVEEVDDTVLESQFDYSEGNLYKPDGDAASFANGTFDTGEMYPKTNEDETDYSDVRSLYTIINSSTRTSDVEAWKTELEGVLNVDVFLKWLAANVVIQNWDTYGRMTHNYYLYNNPADHLLTWIPWDNNEAFQYGKLTGSLSFALSGVSSSWPLISYITAQDDYKQTYEDYMKLFIDEVFIPSKMQATYAEYYDLLKDYAYAETSGYSYISSNSAFDAAVETLKTHVQSRNDALISYLE